MQANRHPPNGLALFGARLVLQRLEALTKEIEGTREAKDIEYLHRMRVASRRLRAALSLFKRHCFPKAKVKAWRKEIRNITKALGDARDRDVQIDFLERWENEHQEQKYQPGIERLLLRLRQDRKRLQAPLLQAINHFENSGVISDIQKTLRKMLAHTHLRKVEEWTPEVFNHAFVHINQRLEEILIYEPFVDNPECHQEHHLMRISAKRLRYTLEIFDPVFNNDLKPYIKQIKQIQSALGEIHDCDVWVEFIPQFIEEERLRTLEYYGHDRVLQQLLPGLECLKEERFKTRQKLHQSFVKNWHQILEAHLFEEIYETVCKTVP